jgi:hypothetical protein
VTGRRAVVVLAALLVAAGCASAPPPAADAVDPMIEILHAHPGLATLVENAEEHRLQVVLGAIEPAPGGGERLVQHTFRAGAEYFYPASSIKLFAAIAALERLNEIAAATGLAIGPDTPLAFHPLFAGEELERRDPSNRDGGTITVRHEIRKLFLVSDNEAFNRLYELVGQDGLAASLRRAGLAQAHLVHRLAEYRTADENRRYPRIDFLGDGFVYTLPERESPPLSPVPALPPRIEVGDAYLTTEDETLVDLPMDFTPKNRIPLVELQRGLCKLVRPDLDCGPGEPYALPAADRELLLEPLRLYPRQSTNPIFDSETYPDHYAKFLLPGLRRALPGREVAVYDKVGWSYGFTTENAYVVDEASGRAFFLAATLYTNANGVLNDDDYEYEQTARPFLEDLAEAAVRVLWPDLAAGGAD